MKQRALRKLEVDLKNDPGPLHAFLTQRMPWVEELQLPAGFWRREGSTWNRVTA